MPDLPAVLLLTPSDDRPLERLLDDLEAFVVAGLRGVLVRERHRPGSERLRLAEELQTRMEQRADDQPRLVAVASPGDGHPTHLRAHEAPLPGVDEHPWGRSCHTARELAGTMRRGASWATLGPYAASVSKPGHGCADRPPVLDVAARARGFPVYALGGVTPANAAAARRWSGHGVAVLGAVWTASDPRAALASILLRADAPPALMNHLDRTTHDEGEAS